MLFRRWLPIMLALATYLVALLAVAGSIWWAAANDENKDENET